MPETGTADAKARLIEAARIDERTRIEHRNAREAVKEAIVAAHTAGMREGEIMKTLAEAGSRVSRNSVRVWTGTSRSWDDMSTRAE